MGDVPEFEENEKYGDVCDDCGEWSADPVVRCRKCDAARDNDCVHQGMQINGQ